MELQADGFAGLPPFPYDVPTAPLLRLSMKDLLAKDEAEVQRLIKACEELGFFYLDLRDAGALTQILGDADRLFEIGAGLFELPLDEKQRYDLSSQKSYFGYKAQGAAVVDRQGNLDRNEFYNVSKDDIMGVSEHLPAPDILKKNRNTLKSFIERSHSTVTLILDLLNTNLGLPEGTLTNIHRLHAVSGDQVRFVKAPPQPPSDRRTALGEHTDFGSVTILFNRLGGLQVLPPGPDENWLYVRPLPGHAIVNLGDAMVKFTNGLLRSNIHRVVSPPGAQAESTRYSLVYFSRPEDDVPLRRLGGSSRIPELEEGVVEEAINSKDWIIRRALGRRIDVPDIEYDKSAGTEMLSRRMKVYPCSWLGTPPSSPFPWSESSPITTPGSNEQRSSSLDSVQARPSIKRSRYPRERTHSVKDDAFSIIWSRRRAFLSLIRDTLLPLLGNSSVDEFLSGTDGSGTVQTKPYVLLDSQPAGLRATLKPYQLEGLSWLLYLRNNGIGGILADDMGLGKTLQTLSLFQSVKDYEAPGNHRFLVNDLTELWSILHWLFPKTFDGKFDGQFLNNVTQFLKFIMLRRTKGSPEIGLSIPPKREFVLSVPLADLQLSWYHRILTGVDMSALLGGEERSVGTMQQQHPPSHPTPSFADFVNLTSDEWEVDRTINAKKMGRITTNTLMELRKCSFHPYLLVGAVPEDYRLDQHIIIIFSGFEQALNLCEGLLEMERVHSQFKHVRLDGTTSAAWRNLSVFLFQNDPRYMVFLLSIRAGGEGLNLVSSSTVIFLDDDWNPQVMRQAEARVHRIGQMQPVMIFRLHSKGTVKDQMRRRLAKKAYLSDKVIEGPGNDVYSPISLGPADNEDISLMPSEDIFPSIFNAHMLESSGLQSIMSSCVLDESTAQKLSPAEERAWLRRSERVRTNVFNGEKVDTSARGYSMYKGTMLDVSTAVRRIGKHRIVKIGGWEVSKESLESGSLMSPTFQKDKPQAKAEKFDQTGKTILCPHHRCCTCEKTATEAGSLLLSCLKCPRAYCENCLDWNKTTFVDDDAGAEARGYSPRNAYFIECTACRPSAVKRQLGYTEPKSRKRARRN
ncbi:hypothetical protein BDV12DRAFT_182930 [Aspergillus spectabilis]